MQAMTRLIWHMRRERVRLRADGRCGGLRMAARRVRSGSCHTVTIRWLSGGRGGRPGAEATSRTPSAPSASATQPRQTACCERASILNHQGQALQPQRTRTRAPSPSISHRRPDPRLPARTPTPDPKTTAGSCARAGHRIPPALFFRPYQRPQISEVVASS